MNRETLWQRRGTVLLPSELVSCTPCPCPGWHTDFGADLLAPGGLQMPLLAGASIPHPIAPAAPHTQGCPVGRQQGPGPDTLYPARPATGCIPCWGALTLLFPPPDPEPLLDRQQWSRLPRARLRRPLRDGALLHVPPCSPPRGRWCLRVPWRLQPRQPRGTDSHGRPLWHGGDEPRPQRLRAEQRAGPQDLQHRCPEDESKGAQRRYLLGDMTGLQPSARKTRREHMGTAE